MDANPVKGADPRILLMGLEAPTVYYGAPLIPTLSSPLTIQTRRSRDIVRYQQPRQRKFRVRTSTIADDLDHMYFLIDNLQFPAAGTFKLQFRVWDVWPKGQPARVPHGPFYVAGHFELEQHVQVKEGKDVKRLNPLISSGAGSVECRATSLKSPESTSKSFDGKKVCMDSARSRRK
ncbi:hypothetical protein QBC32DRAFT_364659 [Pseudoneurospora amorphoporcata]|uniref:Velvet domain-containing protein n=1 Tax=Pseudoneurospora amorphoporcata TaxID=241081 RepID=A0AAN6NQ10_9PEZI|nr:hypothetical protein QBC32DRAFT_364659 [Pseudoneurospora amorphoporcata]